MQFIIDKEARRAYLFANSLTEEISLKTIFAHITGPLPNTVRYVEAEKREGFQPVAAHIEFIDSGARRSS